MSERTLNKTGAAGFTLIELLVAIVVSVALIVGMLNLFDLSNRISIEQTEVAEMQQSHRVAQYDVVRIARETARGMVPADFPTNPNGAIELPNGLAVAVRNNVGAGSTLVAANPASPLLVDGSDVLTLRGIFSSPIYLVNYGDLGAVTVVGDPPVTGTVTLDRLYQGTLEQDFGRLQEVLDDVTANGPEALFVVGPRSDASFSIVELTGGVVGADQATINFTVTGGTRTGAYQTLAPWPVAGMRNIAYVGVLEEYQYFIEQQYRVAGDATSESMPRMARARFYPGTAAPHPSNPTMDVAIADNVFDLQVALGIDSELPFDGQVTENNPPDGVDDWLFNSPADDPTDTDKWVRELVGTDFQRKPLYYLRINTLIHTDRKFRLHFSDRLAGTPVEDRTDYSQIDTTEEQRYRRRWLQSTVDFRNLF